MRQKLFLAFLAVIMLLVAGCGANPQTGSHNADSTSGNSALPSSTFAVTLLPASPSLTAGQSVTFSSPFIGNVAWKVNGVEGGDVVNGVIDSSGSYVSPQVAPAQPIKVTAQLGNFPNAPSASAVVLVQNPSPHLDQISPGAVIAGTPSTLVLAGSGFNPASKILLNGSVLPAGSEDANHLVAQISPELAQNANVLDISILNPTPGGGISAHQFVSVL